MSGRRRRVMTMQPPRGPINAPAPYRDRSTGQTTVDALDVLRHQVAVQNLDATRSRGYHAPPSTTVLGGGKQNPLTGSLGDASIGYLFSTGLLGQIFSQNDNQAVSFVQIPGGNQAGTTSVHDFSLGGLSPQMTGGPNFRLR